MRPRITFRRRSTACAVAAAAAFALSSSSARAQRLSAKWEELTAADFVQALDAAANSCILPFGIVEKHGPAGPLGTDLINVRYTTLVAAAEEYAIVISGRCISVITRRISGSGQSDPAMMPVLSDVRSYFAKSGCSSSAMNIVGTP